MSSTFEKTFLVNADWLLLRSIICLLSGILLWLYPDFLAKAVVVGIGALLILYGIVTLLIAYIKNRKSGGATGFFMFSPIAALLLGMALVIANSFFAKWFIFVIGVLVVLLSVMQMIEILAVRKYSPQLSVLSFLSPMLLFGLGILILINPQRINNLIGYFAAAALIYYGISGFIVAFNIRKNIKKQEKQQNIIDAEFEEVD